MFSRDYLVRQLQQFIQALAMVLMHKRANRQDLALEVIHNTLMDVIGVSREQVLGLSREALLALVVRDGHMRHDLAVAIADLLAEDPEPAARHRAAWLYEEILRTGGPVPFDVHDRIRELSG